MNFFRSLYSLLVNVSDIRNLSPFYEIIPSEEKCSNTGRGGEQSVPNRYARRKITRAVLAEKVNRTPTTLSLKLNGKAPLTLSECVEIINVVAPECTVDYLFETQEKKAGSV